MGARRTGLVAATVVAMAALGVLVPNAPSGAASPDDGCTTTPIDVHDRAILSADGSTVVSRRQVSMHDHRNGVYAYALLRGPHEQRLEIEGNQYESWDLDDVSGDGTTVLVSTTRGMPPHPPRLGVGGPAPYAVEGPSTVGVAFAGGDAEGDLAADGRRVAFRGTAATADSLAATDNGEIWIDGASDGPGFAITDTVGVANGPPAISGDGTRVAFTSDGDLDPGENPDHLVQAFLWTEGEGIQQISEAGGVVHLDLASGGTAVVLETTDGALLWTDGEGLQVAPAGSGHQVSADGGLVTFTSAATLDGPADGGRSDVFAWRPGDDDVRLITTEQPPGGPWDLTGGNLSDDGHTTAVSLSHPGTSTVHAAVVRCSAFDDVGAPHPFFSEIHTLFERGAMQGYADGTFRSTVPVTRQAAAAILWRLAGSPGVATADVQAADVEPGDPFSRAIDWMIEQGFADGYDDETFRPDAPVTRQAFVTWLHRQAGSPQAMDPAPFADVPAELLDAISWAYETGLVHGYAPDTFGSTRSITRQAFAAVLTRLLAAQR
jgi:hypothetical protein